MQWSLWWKVSGWLSHPNQSLGLTMSYSYNFAKWSAFETSNILSNDIATSAISQSRDLRVSETELQSLMIRCLHLSKACRVKVFIVDVFCLSAPALSVIHIQQLWLASQQLQLSHWLLLSPDVITQHMRPMVPGIWAQIHQSAGKSTRLGKKN